MQPEIKERKLLEMGFKKVIMLNFDDVKNLSPQEFLNFITKDYPIGEFFVGYDYRFGKNAEGDTSLLKEFCEKEGIKLNIRDAIYHSGEIVSSRSIRKYLSLGEWNRAIALLGHPLELEALVIHGDSRGKTLGFPTINQALPDGFVDLKFGVYASNTIIDGKKYSSLTNLGIRPTYPLKTPILETHILVYSGDLYGKIINLQLKKFIRDERVFSSKEELISQLNSDIKAGKEKE